MAAIVDVDGDYGSSLYTDTNIVSSGSSYSCIVLFYTPSHPASGRFRRVLFWEDSFGNYLAIQQNEHGRLYIDVNGNAGTGPTTNPVVYPGWQLCWYTRDHTTNTHRLYVNGQLVQTVIQDISSITWEFQYCGSAYNTDGALVKVQSFREWDKLKAIADLAAESNSSSAIDTTGLIRDTPLWDDVDDDSGNNNDWIIDGTNVTFKFGPLPLTSFPFNRVFTVSEFDQEDVVYVYRIPYTQVEYVGIIVDRGTNTIVDLVAYVDGIQSIQFTRSTATAVWRRVGIFRWIVAGLENQSLSAVSNVEISADVKYSITSVPDGSFIINDDTDGYQATVFSPTGDFLGFIENIPTGEIGGSLPSGISLWHNHMTKKFVLLDSNFSLIISPFDVGPPVIGPATFPRIVKGNNKFWVFNPINQSIYTVSTTGAVSGPVATITGLSSRDVRGTAIGVSNDESILYYSSSDEGSIKRWSLVSDSAMSNLYNIPGYDSYYNEVSITAFGNPGDIVVLDDDTVVTWYHRRFSSRSSTVIKISSSGSLMNSCHFTDPYPSVNHLAYIPGFTSEVAIWLFHGSNWTIKVGTLTFSGCVLTDFVVPVGNRGVNYNTSDNRPYIPSNSCTFIFFTTSGMPTTGSIRIDKITSPPNSPVSFSFDTDGTLSPDQFTLSHGQSRLFSDLTPGTYSVSEIVPSGWSMSVSVSNGDPNDAIEVEAGDMIIVTFTNTRVPTSGGIYIIKKESRHDSIVDEGSVVDLKIPDPFIKTAFVGE